MTSTDILTSRRILRQAERAYVAERVSTFALRVSCYFRELELAAFNRRAIPHPHAAALISLTYAKQDRHSINLANRLPK